MISIFINMLSNRENNDNSKKQFFNE